MSEVDAIEAEIKAGMMKKIRDLVAKQSLTHQEVFEAQSELVLRKNRKNC